MKKSLINIIILALVIANLVLTGIMVFVVVPTMNSSNQLIKKISSAVDLELDSQEEADSSTVNIDDIDIYDIEDKMTITLQPDASGKDHYASVAVSLSLNKNDKDYEKYKDTVEKKVSLIKDIVITTLSKYTSQDARANQQAIQDEILTQIQTMYDSKFIIKVSFRDITYQ